MNSPSPDIPAGSTFHQAKSYAAPESLIRLVGEHQPLDQLPQTPEGYYSRPLGRRGVLIALVVFIIIVGGDVIGVYAIASSEPEMQTFPAMLALLPALLPALAAIVAVIVIAPSGRRNRRMWNAWGEVLRSARRERASVHRIWVEFYEGDLSGLVIWAKTAYGASVVVSNRGPSLGTRPLSEQLPREGDEVWIWRTPDGKTFLQAPLRRAGLAH